MPDLNKTISELGHNDREFPPPPPFSRNTQMMKINIWTFPEISNKKAKTCEELVIKKNNFCENIFMTRFFANFRKKLLGTSGSLNSPRGLKRIILHFWPKKI